MAMRIATKIRAQLGESYRWVSRNGVASFIAVSVTAVMILLGSIHRSTISIQLDTSETVRADYTSKPSEVRGMISSSAKLDTTTSALPVVTTNASIYKWVDYDQILKNIVNELERTGWKLPKESIGPVLKRAKFPKKPGVENHAAKTSAQTEVLATTQRWKIATLGCFYESKSVRVLSSSSKITMISKFMQCAMICAQSRLGFFSISEGNQCRCGGRILDKALLRRSRNCSIQCDDRTRTCGGKNSASVYKIAKSSYEKMTKQSVRQSSAGCFEKPQGFQSALQPLAQRGNAAECILECEKRNFAVAARDNGGACFCGLFTERFPLSGLGVRVNDSFCDGPCPLGSAACSDKYFRFWRTYSEDPRCDRKEFLSKSVGRLVALISFPGSGNTWVRYLLETATGIYTGSVFGDIALFSDGFIGERLNWDSRMTSVIKTHYYTPEKAAKFEEAVLIVRNPYEAIFAEINRVRGGHVGYAEVEIYDTIEWLYFIAFSGMKWFRTLESYSEMDKLIIVYYEDIVQNPVWEVRKMVEFLQYPVENLAERLQCLETNMSGHFKRKKKKLNFDPFPPKYRDMMNLYIRTARKMLASKNLPPMPDYER